jgi:hypothetical protein
MADTKSDPGDVGGAVWGSIPIPGSFSLLEELIFGY